MGSGGSGAEATLEDPLLRRRISRRTSTVKPVHTKAATNIRVTACIVLMTRAPKGQSRSPTGYGRGGGQHGWT